MTTVVLPDIVRALYPFKSSFITLSDGQRMHYVIEGPDDGDVLVFMHGYPTWSFAYRALIVYYSALGYRCVAMDHIGWGLSDKPTNRRYHSLERHCHNLTEFLIRLKLSDVTLIMEDWGGPIGLSYAVQYPHQIRRLVISNSWAFQDSMPYPLERLVKWAARPGISNLLFGTLNVALNITLQRWSARQLSEAVLTAYQAPFREVRQRAALIQFPRMVSITPDHPSAAAMRAVESGLASLRSIPTLILWGKDDPIFPAEVAAHWKSMLPRASGPQLIEAARHLLTEDASDAMIQHLNTFFEANPP